MIIGHKTNIPKTLSGVFSMNEVYSKRIEIFKTKERNSMLWPRTYLTLSDFPTTGLVAWWPFEKDLLDYSGAGHHLDVISLCSYPLFIPGRIGPCVYLYGSVLTCANHADFRFGTSDFTINFWIRTRNYGASGVASAGIIGMKAADASNGWLMYNDGNDGKINARIVSTNSYKTTTLVSTSDVWQNWCLTRKTGTMQWYLNGATDGVGNANANNVSDSTSPVYVCFNDTHNVGPTLCLDNVIIANGYAWTSTEISTHYDKTLQ